MSVIQRKYGASTTFRRPLIKRDVADFAVSADWTPVAGDVKVIKDGTAANITTLPTALTSGNTAVWVFSLSATEMQAQEVVVVVGDAVTKAVEDQCFVVETFGNASARWTVDPTVADATMSASDIADAVGLRQMPQSYATDGSEPTLDQAVYLIQQRLTEISISGTAMAIKKLDGTTTAAVLSLNDATNPTSSTRSS